MNSSPNPDDFQEELRGVEAKLRALQPREANLDWPAIVDAQSTTEVEKKAQATTARSTELDIHRHRRKFVLAATWLSGVAAGCLIMANFQSPATPQPSPANPAVVAAGNQSAGMNTVTPTTDIASPTASSDSVVAIIDEPSARLFSASHLSKKPLASSNQRGIAPRTDVSFVPRSTTPAMRGSRRELMDKLLNETAF